MGGQIQTWFPKSIYLVDGLLIDQLPKFETRIKDIVNSSSTRRNGMLNVDSTHKVQESLHTDIIFKDLVTELYNNTSLFLTELGYNQEFISNLKIGNMWANISREGDFLFPHVHPSSIVSGAFYIKKSTNSRIKFFDNLSNMFPRPQNSNLLNYDHCEYDCDPGRLIMFRSDLLHSTDKQQSGEKIVVSFNIGFY